LNSSLILSKRRMAKNFDDILNNGPSNRASSFIGDKILVEFNLDLDQER